MLSYKWSFATQSLFSQSDCEMISWERRIRDYNENNMGEVVRPTSLLILILFLFLLYTIFYWAPTSFFFSFIFVCIKNLNNCSMQKVIVPNANKWLNLRKWDWDFKVFLILNKL